MKDWATRYWSEDTKNAYDSYKQNTRSQFLKLLYIFFYNDVQPHVSIPIRYFEVTTSSEYNDEGYDTIVDELSVFNELGEEITLFESEEDEETRYEKVNDLRYRMKPIADNLELFGMIYSKVDLKELLEG